MREAAVRYRIKGTKLYVQPGAGRIRASSAPLSGPYETTGSGRRSRQWRPASYGPNSALDFALAPLRNQSRDLARTNGYAFAAIERVVSNVVGTGIELQTPNETERALWQQWVNESDADGQFDFAGQQAQAMRGVVEAGEVFARLRNRRPEDGLAVPLQVQLLEAEYCPVDYNVMAPTGNLVRQGVEFDAIGKRVAYWMYRQHPSDAGLVGMFDLTPVRVPASEVLHVRGVGRPGQIRGEPWLTRALGQMRDLDTYVDAELERKKTAAMLVGVIRRPDAGGAKAIMGEEESEDDEGVGEATLEPGTFQYLEPGEEIEFSDPKDVGGQYEVFLRHQERQIAAAIGILYEQLTGDFGDLNDRTWRAAFNEFRRRCESWQHLVMVFQLCRPVHQRWRLLGSIEGSLPSSIIGAPAKWNPQAWPYINPTQDVQARVAEVRAGFTSRSQTASERGFDSVEIDRENAADNARADEFGLRYDSDGRQDQKGGAPGASQSADQAGGALDQGADGGGGKGAQK